MKLILKIMLGVVLAGVLMVGGCMALVGSAANEIDKSIKAEEKNDKPRKVNEGAEFTHDGYRVMSGWKVAKEYGSATVKGLKVKNVSHSGDGDYPQFTFRFYKGSENLAEVECTANEVANGESSGMDCFSLDSKFPKGYEEIRVSDMW